MRPAKTHIRSHHRGTSLLDAVAATIVTVVVIVPSAAVMRDSIALSSRLQTRQEMVARCSSLLEEQLAQQSVRFGNRSHTGLFKHEESQIGLQVICSDSPEFGGQPDRLMAISVLVWHDLNRNRRNDANEPKYSLYSKATSPTVLTSVSGQFAKTTNTTANVAPITRL